MEQTAGAFYDDLKKMKLSEKIYQDKDGNKFKLADLSIDEETEANKLILLMTDQTIAVSDDDSKRLLSLVLQPLDNRIKNFNPGRLNPLVAVEVLHDFLLRQTEKGLDIQNYFSISTGKLKKYIPVTQN